MNRYEKPWTTKLGEGASRVAGTIFGMLWFLVMLALWGWVVTGFLFLVFDSG